MLKLKKMMIIRLSILTLLLGPYAQAAKMYQFTGKVMDLSDDAISLQRNGETLEFTREPSLKTSRTLNQLKLGDEVTIWYTLDARQGKTIVTPKQEPGQVAPSPSPGEKKQIILDDRAFYDACNDKASDVTI